MAGSVTQALYTGDTLEELLKMPVMATLYEYEKEKQLLDMMDEAAVLEILKNESQDADVYTQYSEFQNRMKDYIQRGQLYGFHTVAKDLFNIHNDYHSTIEPIKNAYNKREEARKRYNDAVLKDPSLITNINPNEIGLSAYMNTDEKTAPQMYSLSGNVVMALAEKAMQQASKNRVLSYPVQYAMDNMLLKILSGYGYSENDIDKLLSYPEIQEIKTKIEESPEVLRLGNNKEAVDNYIVRGILLGRLYDKNVSYMNAPKPEQTPSFSLDWGDLDTLYDTLILTDSGDKFTDVLKYITDDGQLKIDYDKEYIPFSGGEPYTTNTSKDIFEIIKKEIRETHPEFVQKGYSDEALYWYYFGGNGLTDAEKREYAKKAKEEGISYEESPSGTKEEVRQALYSRYLKEKAGLLKDVRVLASQGAWDKDDFKEYLNTAEDVFLITGYDSKADKGKRYRKEKSANLRKLLDDSEHMSNVFLSYDPENNQFLAQFNYGKLGARKEKNGMKRYTIGFTPSLTNDWTTLLNSNFNNEYVSENGLKFNSRWKYLQELRNALENKESILGGLSQLDLLKKLAVILEILSIADNFKGFKFDKIVNQAVNTNTASVHNNKD